MILAFIGADSIFSAGLGVSKVVRAIAILVAIGAMVGAIHGLVLVWLSRRAYDGRISA